MDRQISVSSKNIGGPLVASILSIVVMFMPRSSSALLFSQSRALLERRLSQISWVDYSPTGLDPRKHSEPTTNSIAADLAILRQAHFTGLVTYSSSGLWARELPRLAASQGFTGLIIGVWNPQSKEEIEAAITDAKESIVIGICVGNEGLEKRYSMFTLSKAVNFLRHATGKPVTTTEVLQKYSNRRLLDLGDWIFPNVHPYFYSKLDPIEAVKWTANAYHSFRKQTSRLVIFKEVGLPTEGKPGEALSEMNQDRYYMQLKSLRDIRFVYFEAFDQPWKTDLPVESHWGIFRSDRTPKMLACHLMDSKMCEAVTHTHSQLLVPSGNLSIGEPSSSEIS